MGTFSISELPDDGFWGVYDYYIQTGTKQLDSDCSYNSPPFKFCPFCGKQLYRLLIDLK